jgi:hypothetical protein
MGRPEGMNGSRIKFFARIRLCLEFKTLGNLYTRRWWIHFLTGEKWSQQNYEANEKRKWSIGLTISKLCLKQSSKVELKMPDRTCPPWSQTSPPWIVPDLSGPHRVVHNSCAKLNISFSTLILELRGRKSNETWTQWSPQHKEQVPNTTSETQFADVP